MNLFTKQKYIHRHRTNLWLSKGERQGGYKLGVWDQYIHTTIYKIDKQQGPIPCCIGNYTQQFVITYKGKESEKEYIYN